MTKQQELAKIRHYLVSVIALAVSVGVNNREITIDEETALLRQEAELAELLMGEAQ